MWHHKLHHQCYHFVCLQCDKRCCHHFPIIFPSPSPKNKPLHYLSSSFLPSCFASVSTSLFPCFDSNLYRNVYTFVSIFVTIMCSIAFAIMIPPLLPSPAQSYVCHHFLNHFGPHCCRYYYHRFCNDVFVCSSFFCHPTANLQPQVINYQPPITTISTATPMWGLLL